MPRKEKRVSAQSGRDDKDALIAAANADPLATVSAPRESGALLVTLGVLVAALAVYFRTLHPSVAGGDAGELMAVAHELGTPHPPGYPTFAMTTKAAEVAIQSVLPGTSASHAQNSFHAVLSSFAVAFLCLATARLTGSNGAGVLASFLFGFAPNVWTYAVVTEVFPLNNFFMCLLVLLAVDFWLHDRTEAGRAADMTSRARISAFVCGLSLTNQHTSVVFVVPIAAWVVLTNPARYVRDTPALVLMVLLGMSPYLYLPWSSSNSPTTNSWGVLNEWQAFWDHFLRKDYGTFSLASKEANYRVSNFYRAWRFYAGDLRDQLGDAGVAAAVGGVILAGRSTFIALRARCAQDGTAEGLVHFVRRPPVVLVLTAVWFVYCNFFNYLSNLPIDQPLFYGVQQRFWIQPLMLIAMCCGVAFAFTTRLCGIPAVASLVLAAALAGGHVWRHFHDRDESRNFYVRDFGYSVLGSLPPNSILLTKGDIQINSARFAQTVEGFRPDIRILDQELLTYKWYCDVARAKFPDVVFPPGDSYYPFKQGRWDMKMFLDLNRGKVVNGTKRRVFVAIGWKEGDPTHEKKYTVIPYGSTTEVVTHKEKKAMLADSHLRAIRARELAGSLPSLDRHRLPPIGHYSNISWEHVVTHDFSNHMTQVAFELMTHGEHLKSAAPDIIDAVAERGAAQCMATSATEALDSAETSEAKVSVGTRRDDEWTLLCALHVARQMFEDIVKTFRIPMIPTHVRRNLSVALQTLIRLDPGRAPEYRKAMLQHIELHMQEEPKMSAAERANFQQVIEHLSRDV